MSRVLVVDHNGVPLDAASLIWKGKIIHAGNNVYRVSQAGLPCTVEHERTVSREGHTFTKVKNVTDPRYSGTKEEPGWSKPKILTVERSERTVTQNGVRVVTRHVTDDSKATRESTVSRDKYDATTTREITKEVEATVTGEDIVCCGYRAVVVQISGIDCGAEDPEDCQSLNVMNGTHTLYPDSSYSGSRWRKIFFRENNQNAEVYLDMYSCCITTANARWHHHCTVGRWLSDDKCAGDTGTLPPQDGYDQCDSDPTFTIISWKE